MRDIELGKGEAGGRGKQVIKRVRERDGEGKVEIQGGKDEAEMEGKEETEWRNGLREREAEE